jgi:hypothetical protein
MPVSYSSNDVLVSQLPRYQYADLPDSQSFRVLELLPGEPHEPIAVRLQLTNWNNPPSYDALSYVWGEPNFRVPIICQGKRLDCTPNLRHFLETLRPLVTTEKRRWLPDRRIIPKSKLLWADAIG